MKNFKTSLTREQLRGLKRAYQPVWDNREKIWTSENTGTHFDRIKEGIKFSKSLKSKTVKKTREKIAEFYPT